MAVPAEEWRKRRSAARRPVAIAATLRDVERRPFDVAVTDLSETGFRVPSAADLSPGTVITLGVTGLGMRPARVIWRKAGSYGCEFVQPISEVALDQAAAGLAREPLRLQTTPIFTPVVNGAEQTVFPLPAPLRAALVLSMALASWAAIKGVAALIG